MATACQSVPCAIAYISIAIRQTTEIAMNPSTLSSNGRAWLKHVEGLRLQPYDDQTGKPTSCWVRGATVGYGHLISQAEWPALCNGVSENAADALLCRDLAPFERGVGKSIHAAVSQHQFDALVILAYNIGLANFQASSVVKLVNNPQARTSFPDLESAWKAWTRSQGKVMQGLVNRRNAEWNIYASGCYAYW